MKYMRYHFRPTCSDEWNSFLYILIGSRFGPMISYSREKGDPNTKLKKISYHCYLICG